MDLTDLVSNIPGIGESYATKLARLNIETIHDLLDHFPFRYEDFRKISNIQKLKDGDQACIKAKVINFQNIRARRITIQKATLEDSTEQIQASWFHQPFLENSLEIGETFYFTGPVTTFKNKLSLTSPDYEIIKDTPLHTARLVSIYGETKGLSSKWLRQKIFPLLQKIEIDPLANYDHGLLTQKEAYRQIHFPDNLSTLQSARKRLAFNDLLTVYLKSNITKNYWQNKKTSPMRINDTIHQKLVNSLPFKLTNDQNQALDAIFSDLSRKIPMNRLVQGDVGSGKTILALAASLQAASQGLQTLVMAPTQVLATQHFHNFQTLLEPFNIDISLITGQIKNRSTAKILVGTHALLHDQKVVDPEKLGLIVIDEQHRFGVLQRSHFFQKKYSPHILSMSATPIPRTIALSFYGHLDISNIKTMPTGRLPVKTWVVPQNKRVKAYEWIEQHLKAGQQAFIVCPFIDSSTKDSLKNVKAATEEFKKLGKIFSKFKLALLHGKLKANQKNEILNDFKDHKYDILVTTPVIEVGVDIKGATIMVIEEADRFGLSQLHQLRGRVGRSHYQSFCLLFTEKQDSLSRLKLMEKYNFGLDLARLDLKLRGAGELFGTAQSGHLDTQFKMFWNKDLNQAAKDLSHKIVEASPDQAIKTLNALNHKLAKYVSDN